jgi:hypothetical protein
MIADGARAVLSEEVGEATRAVREQPTAENEAWLLRARMALAAYDRAHLAQPQVRVRAWRSPS